MAKNIPVNVDIFSALYLFPYIPKQLYTFEWVSWNVQATVAIMSSLFTNMVVKCNRPFL